MYFEKLIYFFKFLKLQITNGMRPNESRKKDSSLWKK